MLQAITIAEDGTILGSHCCSDEGYMPHDLGIIDGCRIDRHTESYQVHYPNGYQMDFVPSEDIDKHELLQQAFKLNKKLQSKEEQ